MRKLVLAAIPLFICCSATPAMAACSVPNVITNGQVADATKVMDNFNAVVGCVQTAEYAAVNPSGTPTTGSIATFAGPKSVTSGNLTGDVTTSGGTATTLSSSGVAAGSYTGADITVDAKGRVTAASNGAGGSGTSGLIATQVATGTANSITFSAIPQGYRDLVLIVNGQSVNAGQDLAMYVNGDTVNTNYKNATWNRFGNGSVTVPRIGTFPGLNVGGTGSAATIHAQIYSYSSSTWRKNAMTEIQYLDATNHFRSHHEWRWNNTNAITSITLSIASGNIASGTTFSLYVR